MTIRRALALLLLLPAVGCGATGSTGSSLGDEGGPVNLVVGYQPYYAESWSGLILREKKFYEKYLPEGSNVSFQVGLQGSVLVSQLLAGKQDIGYMGDMPAIVGASKRPQRDLRIVGTLGLASDQCAVFLVRNDAPQFADQKEAIAWMDGKVVSTPQGSCTDRIAQATFEQEGVQPKEYLNQALDVIASGFESGKIDAAIVWEPTASRLVNAGVARRVGSGSLLDTLDAGFLVMAKDLLAERPDVAEAWMKAELDAQRFLADPANADEIARIAQEQTQGFQAQDMWDALYKDWPADKGGSEDDVRIRLPFIVPDDARTHITEAAAFLSQIKALGSPELPPGVVDDTVAREVLGDQAPPGEIAAQTGGLR
jgi:NitT/TauT family transport system substrate-binding protein